MADYIEFSRQIKEKYPEYKDVDDRKLAEAMIKKYPVYESQVTFDEPIQEENKGIDITPSGILNKVSDAGAAAVLTPIQMIADRNINPVESYKNAYNDVVQTREKIEERTPVSTGIKNFVTDIGGYSMLPVLRGGGIANFVGNAAIQGGIPGSLEYLKKGENPLEGAGKGAAFVGGLNAGISSIPYVGNVVKTAIANPNVQRTIGKGIEVLTSVPQKFTQRAIDAELAGNSILSGKFNPETAYRPIEQKLRQAKSALPDATKFGNDYYNLGQKALQGMENIKEQANAAIENALEKLGNQEIKNGGLKAAVRTVLDNFGKGGVYNSALEEAPQLVNYINKSLNKEGLTLLDLHRIKEALYDKGYAADAAREGTTAKVARGVAEQINNYLRRVSPGYAKPNDTYSLIMDVTRGLDGQTTMGSKISEIGSVNSAKSGLDQRLQAIDNLLPLQNKFYNDAKNLVNTENEVKDIISTVGKQYERNPRLLANRTDEAFEQTLNDLQTKSGVKFMDELDNIRARDALEKWFPGQGGGSGSAQGAANLVRAGLAGSGLTAGAILHNPLVLPGLMTMSPLIMGRGTIKNLGTLYNTLGGQVPDSVQRILRPLAVKLIGN